MSGFLTILHGNDRWHSSSGYCFELIFLSIRPIPLVGLGIWYFYIVQLVRFVEDTEKKSECING